MDNVNIAIRHFIDSCPIPTGIKDENSKYLYVNQAYADMVNMHKAVDVIGLTVEDLPNTASLCANEYKEQDIQVMQTGKHLSAYCVYRNYSEEKIKINRYTKYPYKDISDKTKGVFFSTEHFTKKALPTIGLIVSPKDQLRPEKNIPSIKSLSSKMQEVLFYVCLGKSAKEIGAALKLSESTIESYVDHLKDCLSVHSKSDLIEYGSDSKISDSILCSNISLIVKEKN